MITTLVLFVLVHNGQPVKSIQLPSMQACVEFKEGFMSEALKNPNPAFEFVCVENSRYEVANTQ